MYKNRDKYQKTVLFSSYIDDENLVDEFDGYVLIQEGETAPFEFKVFDYFDMLVGTWKAKEDCLSMSLSDYNRSNVKKVFLRTVYQEKAEVKKLLAKSKKTSSTNFYDNDNYTYDDYQKDPYYHYPSHYTYIPPKASTGFLDKLNKSDTLVIHCADKTTTMLSQIYDGKNWDVLNDGNIDKEELHKLLESHDKIVCLGHGGRGGLMNIQGGGYVIGDAEAQYLKNKKLFIIWCNASAYAAIHGLHGFITGNIPSDKWEAAGVSFIVDEKYMNDNITFWSKCCANHVEQALDGNYKGAADNIVAEYIAVYGDASKWGEAELGITQYIAERTTAV